MSNDAAKILDTIRGSIDRSIGGIGATIEFGTVISTSPLRVQIDPRKIIQNTPGEKDTIILSPFCARQEFDNFIPTSDRAGGSGAAAFEAHNHDFHVGLWRGLQIGDVLVMSVTADKQTYYALHRRDMVIGDMG